ncbi:MAG: DUF2318 domain-containing protein [Chloroflexi bacterium]|nr:DUF2318 domain-containing protein [Chloroflexota bacterium]
MVESLVITLREGIEAALVVGIILAYLQKTGRVALKGMVYLGVGLAVASSIAFAVLLQALGIDPENEYMEGALFLTAGVMVATLVVWMWRAARGGKQNVERKLDSVVGGESRRGGWGLLVFSFFMVFREGAETVLFLMAATLGEFGLWSLIGGGVGIGLAILFAVFFTRGTLRVNLSRFFGVTSVVLLLLSLKLILGGLHEFAEVGAIPMSKSVMAFIGYFVRDSSSTVILIALMAIPLLMVLWDTRRREEIPAAVASERAADRRKRLAGRQRDRAWQVGLTGVALLIIFAMGFTTVRGSSLVDPEPAPVAAVNGQITVPVSGLEGNTLAKFVYRGDGADLRIIVARAADGGLFAALDACQICGTAGYGQDGENAICKNCNAPIALDTIGLGGGCNPLPLEYRVEGGNIVIPLAEMARAGSVFK